MPSSAPAGRGLGAVPGGFGAAGQARGVVAVEPVEEGGGEAAGLALAGAEQAQQALELLHFDDVGAGAAAAAVGPDEIVEVEAAGKLLQFAADLTFLDGGRRHLGGPGFAQVVDRAAAGVFGEHVARPIHGAAGQLARLGLVVTAGDLVHGHTQIAHRRGGKARHQRHGEQREDDRGAPLGVGQGMKVARRLTRRGAQ